jgi:glycerophosphoryl diester phosphodiesterase
VLIHDETLMRTAGVVGAVPELNAEQLLATDVGRHFHPALRARRSPA